ncbi:MAG: YibE/F family protein [Elusimicrobia bacterium]|nr:YibE/F family protein [Elusimicrobiota bacterium]
MKFRFLVLVCLVLFTTAMFAAAEKVSFPSARVIRIEKEKTEDSFRIQTVLFEIVSGKFKGRRIAIENYLWDDPAYNTRVNTAMTVVLKLYSNDGKIVRAMVKGYKRDFAVIVFFAGFLLLLLFFTGWRFLRVTASFALNVSGVFFMLIPMIKKGINPVAAILAFSFFSLLATLFLITDSRQKAVASFVGTFSSVLIVVFLAFFSLKCAHVTGFYIAGARRLVSLVRASNVNVNLFLVAVSSIVAAALGMAVDVAVSISSFLSELVKRNPELSRRKIFSRGLSVGADIFSTMVNSLFFVFMGSVLPLFLSCLACRIGLIRFVNFESVSFVILQSILSSGVLVLTIPLTAFVSSRMLGKDAL